MHNGVLTKTDKLYSHWDGPDEGVSILHQNVYSSSHFLSYRNPEDRKQS